MERVAKLAAVGLCLVLWPGGALAQESGEPLDVGLEERIDIDYILIDFLVLDGNDRTVPDLKITDFKVKAGGVKIPIDSLDVNCPIGATDNPRDRHAARAAAPAPGAEPHRIVLAFDYDHMTETAEVFDRALAMLNDWPTGDEEHMIASLGEVVRIESPFTRDLDELRWAMRRMRNDRDLYAGNRSRLTETRFFERMKALFDILSRWPGRKSIVLFSGPLEEDGFLHDQFYRKLSALSAAARTAVYPVDTVGLRTSNDPMDPGFGGPPDLRRLANETGGRMTSETNDIALAYAQAQRDMGCVYTLGFYDPNFKLDRDRRLQVKIARHRGLRAVYPDHYVVRSDEEQRNSLVNTASLAPEMFESDEIRTELFVVGASADGNWKTVLGVEMQLASETRPAGTWELRGFLRKPNGTILHSFNRTVSLLDDEAGGTAVAHLFLEMDVAPGDYAASVIFADPRGDPRASTKPVTLPLVPKRGPFLIGPILGSSSGPGFEPLMNSQEVRGDRLQSLTVLCTAGSETAMLQSSVDRWIADLEGVDARRFERTAVQLSGPGMQCHELVDAMATQDLKPGRYEINASAEVADFTIDGRTTEFTVREDGRVSSAPDPE